MNAVKKAAAKKAAVTSKTTVGKTVAPKAKAAKAPVAKTPASKAKAVTKKPAPKAQAPKPSVAKPAAKKVAAKAPKASKVSSAPVKAVAKAVAKAPAKVAPKVASQVSKPAPGKKPKLTAAPVAPKPVAPALAPVAAPRASKASARLAQITVPSMAQTVASTAAKSSYLPTMPSPVISAPLTSVKKNPKLANNWKTKSVDALTDEEILAMPDAEYMNDVQLAFFKRKLIELKQDILNNAGETTEHLREDTVVVPDPADRATIEEEHALELRTRDRERKLLKKIEQSINLIDAGDYGYCDETGEPIGVGRLLARPTATLSLEAQQRRELKQKMFGD